MYEPIDVADTLGVELFGVVPRDASAASMLRGEPGTTKTLARSGLISSAKSVLAALAPDPADEEWRHVS